MQSTGNVKHKSGKQVDCPFEPEAHMSNCGTVSIAWQFRCDATELKQIKAVI
jgi:hypothetical protein